MFTSVFLAVVAAVVRLWVALLNLVLRPLAAVLTSLWHWTVGMLRSPVTLVLLLLAIGVIVIGIWPAEHPNATMMTADKAWECGIYPYADFIDSTWLQVWRFTTPPWIKLFNYVIHYYRSGAFLYYNRTLMALPQPLLERWPNITEATNAFNEIWDFIFQYLPAGFVNTTQQPVFPGNRTLPLWTEFVQWSYFTIDFFNDELTAVKDVIVLLVRWDLFDESCYFMHLTDLSGERWVLRGCKLFRGGSCGDNETVHVEGTCPGCHHVLFDAIVRVAYLLDDYLGLAPSVMDWIDGFIRSHTYDVCAHFDRGDVPCVPLPEVAQGSLIYLNASCSELAADTTYYRLAALSDVRCTDVPPDSALVENMGCDLLSSCEIFDGTQDCALVDGNVIFGFRTCAELRTHQYWKGQSLRLGCEDVADCAFTTWAQRVSAVMNQVREEIGNVTTALSVMVHCFATLLQDLFASLNLMFDGSCLAGAGEKAAFVLGTPVRLIECLKHGFALIMVGPARPLLDGLLGLLGALKGLISSAVSGTILSESRFFCDTLKPVDPACAPLAPFACLDAVMPPYVGGSMMLGSRFTCSAIAACPHFPAYANCTDFPGGVWLPDLSCGTELNECALRGPTPCNLFCTCSGFFAGNCSHPHDHVNAAIDSVFLGIANTTELLALKAGLDPATSYDLSAAFREAGDVLKCFADAVKGMVGLVVLVFDPSCGADDDLRWRFLVDEIVRRVVTCFENVADLLRSWGWPFGGWLVDEVVASADELVLTVSDASAFSSGCHYCGISHGGRWTFEGCKVFRGGACEAVWGVCVDDLGLETAPCSSCDACVSYGTCVDCPHCGDACDVCEVWNSSCTRCRDPVKRLYDAIRYTWTNGTDWFMRLIGIPSGLVELVVDVEGYCFDWVYCAPIGAIRNAVAWTLMFWDPDCTASSGTKALILLEDVILKFFTCTWTFVESIVGDVWDLLSWMSFNVPFIGDIIRAAIGIAADFEKMGECWGDQPIYGYGSNPLDPFNFLECAEGWPGNQPYILGDCDLAYCFNVTWSCMRYEANYTAEKEYQVVGFLVRDFMRRFIVGVIDFVDEIACRIYCVFGGSCLDCAWYNVVPCVAKCLFNPRYRCAEDPYDIQSLWDEFSDYDCFDKCSDCSDQDHEMACYAFCFMSKGTVVEPCTRNLTEVMSLCYWGSFPYPYNQESAEKLCDAYRFFLIDFRIYSNSPHEVVRDRYALCTTGPRCGDCLGYAGRETVQYKACIGICMLGESAWAAIPPFPSSKCNFDIYGAGPFSVEAFLCLKTTAFINRRHTARAFFGEDWMSCWDDFTSSEVGPRAAPSSPWSEWETDMNSTSDATQRIRTYKPNSDDRTALWNAVIDLNLGHDPLGDCLCPRVLRAAAPTERSKLPSPLSRLSYELCGRFLFRAATMGARGNATIAAGLMCPERSPTKFWASLSGLATTASVTIDTRQERAVLGSPPRDLNGGLRTFVQELANLYHGSTLEFAYLSALDLVHSRGTLSDADAVSWLRALIAHGVAKRGEMRVGEGRLVSAYRSAPPRVRSGLHGLAQAGKALAIAISGSGGRGTGRPIRDPFFKPPRGTFDHPPPPEPPPAVDYNALARHQARLLLADGDTPSDPFIRFLARFGGWILWPARWLYDYFTETPWPDVAIGLAELYRDVVYCYSPEQYNGTRVYNVFCFPHIPEVPFDLPRLAELVPHQLPWDDALIKEDCRNFDKVDRFYFELFPNNCERDDNQSRPLCPWCHYCERLYNVSAAGVGGIVDNVLIVVNALERLIDCACLSANGLHPNLADGIHMGINCLVIFFLYMGIGSILAPGLTLLAPWMVMLYLLYSSLWCLCGVLVIGLVFVAVMAGVYASYLAFWALLTGFFVLSALNDPVAPGLDVVCWLSGPLAWMRDSGFFWWIPFSGAFADSFERTCYGPGVQVPMADLQIVLIYFAVTVAGLLLTGIFVRLLLILVLRFLLAILALLWEIVLVIAMLIFRIRVARMYGWYQEQTGQG